MAMVLVLHNLLPRLQKKKRKPPYNIHEHNTTGLSTPRHRSTGSIANVNLYCSAECLNGTRTTSTTDLLQTYYRLKPWIWEPLQASWEMHVGSPPTLSLTSLARFLDSTVANTHLGPVATIQLFSYDIIICTFLMFMCKYIMSLLW